MLLALVCMTVHNYDIIYVMHYIATECSHRYCIAIDRILLSYTLTNEILYMHNIIYNHIATTDSGLKRFGDDFVYF